MRKIILIFSIFTIVESYAQIDAQWYLLNNRFINSPRNLSSTTISPKKSYNIYGVEHPYRPVGIDPLRMTRNDLFIIYNDGTHFNSKNIDLTLWRDRVDDNINNYFLNSDRTISHMYFTNVYEGNEEPTAYITPSTVADPTFLPNQEFTFQGYQILSNNSPIPSPITANHSPVPGKDITLIIYHDSLEKTCTYDLCYDINSMKDITSSINPAIEESNIFGNEGTFTHFAATGNGNGLLLENYTLNDSNNCITGIQFNKSNAFTYINFRLSEDPDSILSHSEINFRLLSPGCDNVTPLTDTIKNSHDPNFVKLVCVHKPDDCKYSTIQYYAQCMNDGQASQDNPSIELTFPFSVTASDITVNSAGIRKSNSPTLFNQESPCVTDVSTDRVMFQFDGNLGACEPPLVSDTCIAWVKFCVKVDSIDVNVLKDPLEPFNRNTNFGSTAYVIADYTDIDFVCDTIYNVNNTNQQSEELPYITDCKRPITDPCPCKGNPYDCKIYYVWCHETVNWPVAGGLIVLLILLGLIFIGKRRKP